MIQKRRMVKCSYCAREFDRNTEGTEGYVKLQKVYVCEDCFNNKKKINEDRHGT